MELTRGITGIVGSKEDVPPSDSKLDEFRTHCHLVARKVGATVRSFENPGDDGRPSNHAIATFEFSDSKVVAMLNCVRPILAFARPPGELRGNIEFVNCPKMAQAFLEFGDYRLTTTEELNRPVLRELCEDLTPTEQKRVRYFRPQRIGDVVFNGWD